MEQKRRIELFKIINNTPNHLLFIKISEDSQILKSYSSIKIIIGKLGLIVVAMMIKRYSGKY